MKTRRREINQESVVIPTTSYTLKHTNCSGVTAFTPTVLGARAAVTASIKESISGGTGKGRPHQVCHRKLTRKIFEGANPFRQGGSGPGGGQHDEGYATQEVEGYSTYVNWEQHEKMTYNVGTGSPWAWQLTEQLSGPSNYPPDWLIGSYGSIDDTALKNDVIDRARQLKADVLLNLVEANQIIPSLKALGTVVSSMRRNSVPLRTALKQLSGGYLAYKFGIKPILSDLHNIWTFLPQMKKAYDRHSKAQNSRFSAKAELSATWSNAASIAAGHWPANPTWNGRPWWVFTGQGRVERPPTVRYVLVVKPRQFKTSVFQHLDFALSRFATSPASLAWERIPFSFVLDWLVDVRGALRGVDNLVGFSPFEVVSFTRSFSYKLSTDTFLKLHTTCPTSGVLFDGQCGSEGYSHYERSLVTMSGSLPVLSPRFGKNQAAVSVALITQILANRKG